MRWRRRYQKTSKDPIRPQLCTEQIVTSNDATHGGSVQGEIDELDELRARVDELARQHEVRDTIDVPMIRSRTNQLKPK